MPIEFGFSEEPSKRPEYTDIIENYAILQDVERGRMVVLLSFSDDAGGVIDSRPLEGTHAYKEGAGMYKNILGVNNSRWIQPNETFVEPIQFEGSKEGFLWIRHFKKT